MHEVSVFDKNIFIENSIRTLYESTF